MFVVSNVNSQLNMFTPVRTSISHTRIFDQTLRTIRNVDRLPGIYRRKQRRPLHEFGKYENRRERVKETLDRSREFAACVPSLFSNGGISHNSPTLSVRVKVPLLGREERRRSVLLPGTYTPIQ